jgi:hypothetical protein
MIAHGPTAPVQSTRHEPCEQSTWHPSAISAQSTSQVASLVQMTAQLSLLRQSTAQVAMAPHGTWQLFSAPHRSLHRHPGCVQLKKHLSLSPPLSHDCSQHPPIAHSSQLPPHAAASTSGASIGAASIARWASIGTLLIEPSVEPSMSPPSRRTAGDPLSNVQAVTATTARYTVLTPRMVTRSVRRATNDARERDNSCNNMVLAALRGGP